LSGYFLLEITSGFVGLFPANVQFWVDQVIFSGAINWSSGFVGLSVYFLQRLLGLPIFYAKVAHRRHFISFLPFILTWVDQSFCFSLDLF
jgi:hypothetical protein